MIRLPRVQKKNTKHAHTYSHPWRNFEPKVSEMEYFRLQGLGLLVYLFFVDLTKLSLIQIYRDEY